MSGFDDLAGFLEADVPAVAVAGCAEAVQAGLERGLALLTGGVPVLSGALRANVRPYAGEPGPGPGELGKGPTTGEEHGAADVAAAMKGWTPGAAAGLVSDLEYSATILLDGGSPKWGPERMEALIQEMAG